jgi:hypothetical protein
MDVHQGIYWVEIYRWSKQAGILHNCYDIPANTGTYNIQEVVE